MSLSPDLLTQLEGMPAEFARALSLVPASALRWKPGDMGGSPGEHFSALEHACHLRDIEADGYHVRFRRLLAEDRPSLVSLDGDAMAVERNYAADDLEMALAAFGLARAQTVALLRGLGEADLARSGDFAEYGTLTVRSLAHYLRAHDQQHLACIHWLMGRLAGAEVAAAAMSPRS